MISIKPIKKRLSKIVERKNTQNMMDLAKFPSENPNPVLRITKDGKILYSNEAGRPLLAKWNSEVGKHVPEKWLNLIAKIFASDKEEEEEEEEEEAGGKIFAIAINPIKEAGYVNLYGRDITKHKQTEMLLRESEEHLRLKLDSILSPDVDLTNKELENIFDTPSIQAILDDLSKLTNMCTAIVDLRGNILVATGWQDICTKFHRINPLTAQNCIESDIFLTKNVKSNGFVSYKCKNHLWDAATPLFIGEKHVANMYTGQFFYEDEVVDTEWFIKQADKYGFDKEAYLSALNSVPRISREKPRYLMNFLIKFSELISKLSCSNIKLTKAIAKQKEFEEQLQARNKLLSEQQENLQNAYAQMEKQSALLAQSEKTNAIGTLVAGTAHELNNPLMAILNFSAYCRKHTSEDNDLYPILEDIEHEAKRCAEIVQNLLTFSHTEQQEDKSYEKGNLAEVINRVLKLLSYRIEKENILVTLHIAEETPEIWMNANSIQQVILNLTNNAFDALEASKKKEFNVDIHPKGECVIITIADTGCGIPAKSLGAVFDPFFTTKPIGKGTGLGLSVSQGIIKSHAGQIFCSSDPNVGTKFTILLPIENVERKKQDEQTNTCN